MRGCELLYDEAKAERLQEMVTDALGHCPCDRDEPCIALPRNFTLRTKNTRDVA